MVYAQVNEVTQKLEELIAFSVILRKRSLYGQGELNIRPRAAQPIDFGQNDVSFPNQGTTAASPNGVPNISVTRR
jgi:hypothetical protein